MHHRYPFRIALFLVGTVAAAVAQAQCGAVSFGPPLPIASHAVPHERDNGPAQFVIPTLVHVYYAPLAPPVSTQRVVDMIAQANAMLRGHNSDTADVCSLFRPLIGDLSVELRLAHLDANGNCTSGIDYIQWDGVGLAPDPTPSIQNTGRYLNIVIHPGTNSMSYVPSPGVPLPGDVGDRILITSWDAEHRPWVLAHEVGHWVGLYHTFGATNTSGVTCGDDGVADTPMTAGSPVGTCDTTLSTCTPGVIENVDNAMDYSICEKMFTIGQAERVAAVMTDTAIARANHCTPENLLATGVDIPSSCALWSAFDPTVRMHCGNADVRYRSMFMGQVPDQYHWSFPGGSPATSTESEPDILYTEGGIHTAQLIACFGAECDTVTHDVTIDPITGIQDNGLAVGTTPWSEGFENDFSFPQAHMAVRGNATSNWQPCGFTGYNSAHSLYIPASSITAMDTSDLVLGNFDFTGMASPGISFKLAATYYEPMQYSTFYLMLGDLCDQGLPLQPWSIYLLPDLAGSNANPDFVPSGPDQWISIHYTTPSWTFYPHAQLVLRVVKTPMWPLPDEDLFIDDINIGEADFVLGTQGAVAANALQIFPDPANDRVTILTGSTDANAQLRIIDMQGREVFRGRALDRMMVDVAQWPSGSYALSIVDGEGARHERLVVRH